MVGVRGGLRAGLLRGPLWCLRGPAGERLPFDLQAEIDRSLAELGLQDASFRAYGLRHLGRTEHRRLGFPELYLNFKMNHDGLGYEHYNPARLSGYRRYRELDNQVTQALAQAYGLADPVRSNGDRVSDAKIPPALRPLD